MSTGDPDEAERKGRKDERSPRIAGATFYFIVVGLALLGAAVWAIEEGSDTAAAALILLGGGACILAPFAPNIEGTLKLGTLEVPIRRRVAGALAKAPPKDLQAILSILESEDVGVEVVPLPERYSDQTLRDGEGLKTWRPDRGLSVIAVRRRAGDPWLAGGQVTDMRLDAGMELLVSGPRQELARLRNE